MLSIIIPIYQEGENLAHLLSLLQSLQASPVAAEIIIVDGGSSDEGPQRLTAAGYRVLSSERGRGQQLIAGVSASSGDKLLFLHADSAFDVDPLKTASRLLDKAPCASFSLAFLGQGRDWRMRMIAWGSNWRVRHRHIAFGDQGICIRREVYEAVGGFKPLPLMEDYDLSIRLKAAGYYFAQSEQNIWTSPRRFYQNGVWRTLYQMQKYQHQFRKGNSAREISKNY